jgi:hypothetical protein
MDPGYEASRVIGCPRATTLRAAACLTSRGSAGWMAGHGPEQWGRRVRLRACVAMRLATGCCLSPEQALALPGFERIHALGVQPLRLRIDYGNV